MIRRNINLDDISTESLDIGFVGEANHVEIAIHCAGFFKEYPDATAMMTVAPPVGEMYPVQLERDEQALIWEISEGDLAYAGAGTYQLTFTENEEIIKTVYGSYSVAPSLVPTGDPPDPIENWIERAEEALAEFQQDVTTAEAWAAGTRDGEPVPSTDPAYENNSKYYAEEAAEIAASIPEDYSELSADVEEMKSSKAPVIINTASGAIASFSDGASGMPVKKLVVAIDPVQDLHGYENPWPAGGGKNKIDGHNVSITSGEDAQYAVTDSTVTLAAGTYTLSFTVGTTVTSTRNRPMYLVGNTPTYSNSDFNTSGRQSWTFTLAEQTTLQVKWWGHTLSANCMISDFMLESGSSASSFAPYSNVCPISGWTGANVSRTGKNLLDKSKFSIEKPSWNEQQYWLGLTKNQDDTFTLTRPIGWGGCGRITVGTFKAGTYVFSYDLIDSANVQCAIQTYAFDVITHNLLYTNVVDNIGTNGRKECGMTINSDFILLVSIGPYTANGSEVKSGNYQIELGSTASTYEAFSGSTTEYEFPQEAGTVYGGSLTIHQDGTGELVVKPDEVDLSSLNWTISGNRARSGDIASTVKLVSASVTPNAIASKYKVVSANSTLTVGEFAISDTGTLVFYYDGETPTGQLVYELATPIVYELTNQQVISLLHGANNVWADTGDVALEYPADTKLYIDGKIAEIQALILENISNS